MPLQIPEIPPEATALIGKPQYEEETEFPIEMSYVWNTCAAVQNANPLYWDPKVAEEITHGQITPPTMLSVWFRPHHWSPGVVGDKKPMRAHFDIKEILGLPEAIVASNETIFGEPVRLGDTLFTHQVIKSISEVKTTKLGTGRFWVVDVETVNERREHVGSDIYSFFGYKRA
ncbi:MAG: hypothetical protein HOC23_02810 [Halieaceae bacterium]|nr:hypothetical protein [Halieaceae bacterium]